VPRQKPAADASAPGLPVSLIITVRDDREGFLELLDSLALQDEMPDEIVVVDGGSADGTLDVVDRWDQSKAPLRVVRAPGANIAMGRNIAVRNARHDWIACTDAGCRPIPGWLGELSHARASADLAAGVFVVDADSALEQAVKCTHYPALSELEDPNPLVKLAHGMFGRDFRAAQAAGRSMAFSRAAWIESGGFPEHVHAGEDVAFSAAVVDRGFRATLVDGAVVHWRARQTWRETGQMFRTYTRGDIRTKGRSRHALRLIAWTCGPALALRGGRGGRYVVAAGTLAYLWLPLRRAHRIQLPVEHWWRIPALVALKDLSQIAGSALGLMDAARGVSQPPPKR
jgi:glycosyltransferase involved in cell wall biosynthesis